MPEIELRPMSESEYAAFRERSEQSYAAEIAISRGVPPAEARRQAEDEHRRLLPDGPQTPGHYLWTAWDEGAVGDLWLHLEEKPDGLQAFGYAFEVRADLRRRGYGRAMTAAAERRCRELGVVAIGLTVFGPNDAARRLYEDLGFEVTVLQMRKKLRAADAGASLTHD